jgi:acyl-CoA thioesterase FadM
MAGAAGDERDAHLAGEPSPGVGHVHRRRLVAHVNQVQPGVERPTVVLASATAKFLGPVVAGERLEAEANVERTDGRKRWVKVTVRRGDAAVMEGEFMAVVPDHHILDVPKR